MRAGLQNSILYRMKLRWLLRGIDACFSDGSIGGRNLYIEHLRILGIDIQYLGFIDTLSSIHILCEIWEGLN